MTNAQVVFDYLRKFFENQEVQEHEKARVWRVLTALRGPDTGDEKLKAATTAVIRGKVFGGSISEQADTSSDSERHTMYRLQIPNGYDHFIAHARDAFNTLGMNWDYTNTF